MTLIYLDNNATTRPAKEVVEAVNEAMDRYWGNPSSLHRFGQEARRRVELARESVAKLIGAAPGEVVFTSGGTESINLAIVGAVERRLKDEDRGVIISTRVEHSAVRETIEFLVESRGRRAIWAPVDRDGVVDLDAFRALVEEHESGVAIVSIQWANNETGAIQPVEEIARIVKSIDRQIIVHTDAVQWVGKGRVDVKTAGVDLLSLSGHKLHGPKGIGGLYVRRGVRLTPLIHGGPHERERRGGTENAPGIIGLGVAAEMAQRRLNAAVGAAGGGSAGDAPTEAQKLRDRFEQRIIAETPESRINSATARYGRLWNTSNIAFHRLEAEAILLLLSERGVCASAGAACSSGSLDPSPVLLAMGVEPTWAHGSIRFSLSHETTEGEIDEAARIINAVIARLRSVLPVADS